MISAEAVAAIKAHAVSEYPHEACGVVLDDGSYRPLKNVSDTPEQSFAMQGAVYAELSPRVQVVVHSHPDGPDCPSEADMRSQIVSAKVSAIVSCNADGAMEPFLFGDGAPIAPLVGRGFRHGVTDCYALIRDYYRLEREIELPEFPRGWSWWDDGQDLYQAGFADAGFRQIDVDEVREGDVFLASIRSDVPNHGGVMVGNGLALHHLCGAEPVDPTRLSRREPVGRWGRLVSHWLRHVVCDG